MLNIILRMLGQAIPGLFVLVTVTFFLIRIAPGGPFDREKAVSPEILVQLKEQYHMNDPLHLQYLRFLNNLVHLDFGPSFKHPGRTVNEMILEGLPATFELGGYAILFALILGISAGVFSALNKNTYKDYVPMGLSMFGICLPSFLLGPLLVLVFGIWFGLLPVSGWEDWDSKILPSITLGSAYAAYIARLSRGGMLEILTQDFI